MIKNITCIECPKGCKLTVDIEGGKISRIENYQCPKGMKYAQDEVLSPSRIITSAVLAEGLSLKMVPVRTDKPIPKGKLLEAMEKIKKIRLNSKVRVGDVIADGFIEKDIKLISTRSIH